MIVRARRVSLAIAMVALFPFPSRSQAPNATEQSTPPRRAHHALVYDASRQRVLLTGGSTPADGGRRFVFFDDVWEYDGARWVPLPATGRKLSGIQLAYDGKLNRVLSFGGYDGDRHGDLRELRDGAWRTIGPHPEVRTTEPGFVYDSRRGRFVLFGGGGEGRTAYGETWEYDGAEWRKIQVEGPPGRQALGMVFDATRGRTVLFGGMGAGVPGQPPPMLGDTWEFDGDRWVRCEVAGPSPRSGAGMAFDSKRGRVVLFGGMSADGFKGDTWAWDGTSWKLVSEGGPAPRAMGYLAYDQARDRVVLFGGRNGYPDGDRNDTWEWDGTSWKEPAGSGAMK